MAERTVELVGSPLGDRQTTVTGNPGRYLYSVSLTGNGPVLEKFCRMRGSTDVFVYESSQQLEAIK